MTWAEYALAFLVVYLVIGCVKTVNLIGHVLWEIHVCKTPEYVRMGVTVGECVEIFVIGTLFWFVVPHLKRRQ